MRLRRAKLIIAGHAGDKQLAQPTCQVDAHGRSAPPCQSGRANTRAPMATVSHERTHVLPGERSALMHHLSRLAPSLALHAQRRRWHRLQPARRNLAAAILA